MAILNESGVPDVLSPLHAVNGLAERLPDALIIVVGTRAEAYLSQTLARSPRNRRLLYLIFDPGKPPAQGKIASQIIETVADFRGIEMVLLVAGRTAALIGVDAAFEARLASRRLDLAVKAVDPAPDPDTPHCLCTDLEDQTLAALVETCPTGTSDLVQSVSGASKRGGLLGGLLGGNTPRTGRSRPVVLLGGTSASDSAGELASELGRAGIEVAGTIPANRTADLPVINEGTIVAVIDPYLTSAARAAAERGARIVRTLSPIGVEATARFIQEIGEATGMETSELGRARTVWESLEHLRTRVRGKRVFFAGDTGLEVALARFLSDAGAVVMEVGMPWMDRKFLAAELRALDPTVDVVELPDWRGQIERIDAARPDIVVTGPGLYAPLVARGHLCRSSLDFLELGVHGYEGARRMLELLVRTFERADALDFLSL